MAELADAHGSGPCARKGMGVQVSPGAPNKTDYFDRIVGLFFFIKNAQILQYCGILRFLQILNE